MVKTSAVCPTYARTPLSAPFEESLNKAGASFVKAEAVAKSIVKQVLSGSTGQVVLPSIATPVTGIRGWPNWLSEHLRDGAPRAAAPVSVVT